MKQLRLVLLTVSLFASTAIAGDAAPPVQTSAAGIKYVVGGVGADERKAMRSKYPFKLRVEHATQDGSYSSGMHIRINNAQGQELLETLIDGPWLLFDLPAGKYSLTVLNNQREYSRTITLGNEVQQQVVFLWPQTEPAGP